MRKTLPMLLAGAALLFGAAIVYEAVLPLDPPEPLAFHPPPRPHSQVRPPAYAPPPVELFADIDARPLFAATRKPLPDLAQANGAAAATADFSLAGVIMSGTRAVALLRLKSTNATESVAVGDLWNGWRVSRIDATTVTLRANGGDFVVALAGPASQPPTAALSPIAEQPAASPSPTTATPATAATPPAAAATAPAASGAAATTAKPGPPAHKPTIAPEALRGAPIDPATGEPTL